MADRVATSSRVPGRLLVDAGGDVAREVLGIDRLCGAADGNAVVVQWCVERAGERDLDLEGLAEAGVADDLAQAKGAGRAGQAKGCGECQAGGSPAERGSRLALQAR
jgi:hypothetical protein